MEKQKDAIILPAFLNDGMVLQRESRVRIWGKAVPGAELKLTFRGRIHRTLVSGSGDWEIELGRLKAGGPDEMLIECESSSRLLKDILVGDVWLLGGQSNMQIPIRRTLDLFADEVKNAEYPELRSFTVPQEYDFHGPREEVTGGSWVSVNPSSIYDFSAIGYFFAKRVHEKYKIPIGLIQSAIGGTPVEAWMSEQSLRRFKRFQDELTLCKDDTYVNGTKQKEEQRNNRWYGELYEKDEGLQDAKGIWYSEDYDDSAWKVMEIPRSFEGTELEDFKGSVWFRKEIDIPKGMLKGKGKIAIGTIIDADDTYINGVQIGNTGYLYPPRRYEIPEGLLQEGRNVITVRVLVTQNTGGFVSDMPYYIRANGEELPISGTWKYKIGAVMKAQLPTTFFQYKPTGVFNGMIYPLRKYAIKGIMWYQGESNTGYPYDYKELFEAVIKDWRELWNLGELPFLYVQLPNFCLWKKEPDISGWARLRNEQRKALEIPGTGMVVAIDKGMYNDLHPWDKKSIGDRLFLLASDLVYGEELVGSGPLYDYMERDGASIKLHFKHTGSGLMVKGDKPEGFELCGADGVYYPADAVLEKHAAVVTSRYVKEPMALRYAWADNPEEANLYNREGLPASPFETN